MNRKDLQHLQAIESYPSLTIILPTHRTSPDNQQDPIRLKNLVKEAQDRLLSEFSQRDIAALQKNLDDLVERVDFEHNLDGLVLFVNADMARMYTVPFDLPERVVIDHTFATRDLVYALNRTQHYWVLLLSEQPTRLFEAVRADLVEVNDGTPFPMVNKRPGGESRLPGGIGVNASQVRDDHERIFFQQVDQAFAEFYAADPQPVAVLSEVRTLASFDAVTRHNEAIIARVGGNYDHETPHEIGKIVWPTMSEAFAELRKRSFESLDAALSSKRSASGIVECWRMGQEGRIDLLLVAENYEQPAVLDETGFVLTPVDELGGVDVHDDAVDELIEIVLSKGGRIRFTDPGTLDDHSNIAAVLRY
ncbi:hypothetical protein HC891_02885 [Candidatus Gracilibacteria bacterium]|nr:hypothetical protein [Candidatus Gracilibacteria bacterium]